MQFTEIGRTALPRLWASVPTSWALTPDGPFSPIPRYFFILVPAKITCTSVCTSTKHPIASPVQSQTAFPCGVPHQTSTPYSKRCSGELRWVTQGRGHSPGTGQKLSGKGPGQGALVSLGWVPACHCAHGILRARGWASGALTVPVMGLGGAWLGVTWAPPCPSLGL